MKKKYGISLAASASAAAFLLGWFCQPGGYRAETPSSDLESPVQTEKSISTKGKAEKSEGYYLCELHGYVVVYLEDKKTIYEITEIPLSSLPKEVQGEVRAGKPISTEEELYAFLENYSS